MSADAARARQIELILEQVDTLPTLSPIATRLLEITSAEDADLREIARVIESDPALTTRILGLCRKASTGLGRVATVQRAVVMLGLEAVQAAVLSVSVYELLNPPREPFDAPPVEPDTKGVAAFDRAGFWKHAISTACAAELLAELHPSLGVRPEEAFVAGLLHDLGKAILDLIVPRAYVRVVQLSERRHSDAAPLERTILGLDHHTAGKRIAEHWGLPHVIQDVMWLHGQDPASLPDLPHRSLISLVTLASIITRRLHLGWSGDFAAAPAFEPYSDALGISVAAIDGLAGRLLDAIGERCRVLGIDNKTTPDILMQSVAAANRKMGRLIESLDQRGKENQQRGRLLEAIAHFVASTAPTRGIIAVFGEIAASASKLMGPGLYAVLFQNRHGQPVQLLRFGADGALIRSEVIEGPPDADLGPLMSQGQLSTDALGVLPWVKGLARHGKQQRTLHLLPLSVRRGQNPDGPWTLLVHEHEIDGVLASGIGAISSVWASAIAASAHHDGAKRIGESLADANRRILEMQSRLTEAQSMARLGELAAGAAHEMNNPLTVISGQSQLLATRLEDPKDAASARAIVEASATLGDLVTGLHTLSERPVLSLAPVDPGDILTDAVRIGAQRARAPGRIKTDAPAVLPDLYADRQLLAQAIGEVLANAIQHSGSEPIRLGVRVDEPEHRLEFTVSDSGPGMSQRTLEHAFDPFYSERQAGRGTGLGLTRAKRFVELHRGGVALRSAPGQGTTVTIWLPILKAGSWSADPPNRLVA